MLFVSVGFHLMNSVANKITFSAGIMSHHGVVFNSSVSFLLAQFIDTASLVIMGLYMSKENMFLHFLQLFVAVQAIVTLVKRLPLDVVICIVSCLQFDVSDHPLLNGFQFILVNLWKS